MKLRVPEKFVQDVRDAIAQVTSNLKINKAHRKTLMAQIAHSKGNIRTGEALSSKLESGLIPGAEYVRDDLKKKRDALQQLRVQLLSAETQHKLERARSVALHGVLDAMKQPLNPEAAGRKRP